MKNHVAIWALAAVCGLLSPQAGAIVQHPAGIKAVQAANVLPRFEPSFPVSGDSGSQWFSVPTSISAGPDPSVAWLMALGFLGLVIMRRTRS